MVSMRIWIIGTLMWCVALSVLAGDIKEERKQLNAAIRQLQEEKADLAMIETLGQSIAADSPLYPIAIQTVAWMYIKNGEYSKAWKLTQRHAPTLEEESLALVIGHHQLTLWLAMESGQTELATQHLKALVKELISREELTVPEKRTLSGFLGGICAIATADPHPTAMPDEIVDRAIELLGAHESKTVVEHFRAAFEKAKEAATHLTITLDRVAQQSETESREALEQAREELEQCQHKHEFAHQAWESERQALRHLHRDTEDSRKAERHAWRILTTTEEPGRPNKPSEPRPPKEPSGSRYGKDADKGEWEKYDREQASYNRQYRDYVNESKTYPDRLRAWQDRNAKRHQRLAGEHQQANAHYVQMKAKEDAQQDVVKEHEKLKTQLDRELRQAKIVADSIDAALKTKLDGVDKSAHRPSLFDVIDFTAEAERLLACVRHVAK